MDNRFTTLAFKLGDQREQINCHVRRNARALRKCAVAARRIGNPAIIEALHDYVRQSPPGYSLGIDFEGTSFRPTRCEFAEVRDAAQKAPDLAPAIWLTSTHMFHGITNIKSRVNYFLPAGSPLRGRISF